jgi:hypothetical protein
VKPRGSQARARLALGIVVPIGFAGVAVLPVVGLRSRLPEPVATHWGLSGAANGSMRFSTFLVVTLLMSLVSATVMMALSRRRAVGPGELGPGLAGATFVLALTALLTLMIVAANLDLSDWRRARLPFLAPLIAAAVAMGVAAFCARLARRLESEAPRVEHVPSAGLGPGERAGWVGAATNRWVATVSVCLAAAGLALIVAAPATGAPLLVSGVVTAALASVRVSVGASGVRVAYGWLRWPSTRIGTDSIRRASVVEVKPSAWGGWGYRGSLRLQGRAAVVVRAGDGLCLHLRGGRVFTVTVDGATTAARVLNDMLSRLDIG